MKNFFKFKSKKSISSESENPTNPTISETPPSNSVTDKTVTTPDISDTPPSNSDTDPSDKTPANTDNLDTTPLKLLSLAPNGEIENGKQYNQAIKSALDDANNLNIAIAGPYGSGKSSVLLNFKNTFENEYGFLNISLASFNIDNDKKNLAESKKALPLNKRTRKWRPKTATPTPKNESKSKNELDQLVELSILQQLIYQVDGKDLPHSRFHRIINVSANEISNIAILILITILSMIFVFEPKFITNTTLWSLLNWTANGSLFSLFAFLCLTCCMYLFVKYGITQFTNSKLSKLSLKDGAIEVSNPSELSILNKYLDEIIYFFERTKHNVVIIEDLDRFENPHVLTKLRELNLILNKSKQIKFPIVFIYALKDDALINATQRTKFFDLIIPIIPVVNTSNSGDMLHKLLGDGHDLDQQLIKHISFYVGDMRLLKNIYNEYTIYKSILPPRQVIQDKLFAMIVYKNMFPVDFDAMHIGSSLIYRIFKPDLSKLTKQAITKIQEKIKECNNIMSRQHQIQLKNETELNSLYVLKIISKYPGVRTVPINGEDHEIQFLSDPNNFNLFLSHGISGMLTPQGISRVIVSLKIGDIETLDDTNTYNIRLNEIRRNNEKTLNDKKNEIERLNQEINKIRMYSLEEIMRDNGIEETFKELAEPEHQLTIYLLRNGYIDRTFLHYISFLYPGSLTLEDRAFVLSVLMRKVESFEYELYAISNIIEELSLKDFSNPEILNYQLVEFLLSSPSLYKEQLGHIMTLLSNGFPKSKEFIDGFIDKSMKLEIFIKLLANSWKKLWYFVAIESDYSLKKKNAYLTLLIKHADLNDIQELNIENCLLDYIESKSTFSYTVAQSDTERAKQFIESLNIKFKDLFTDKDERYSIVAPLEKVDETFKFNENLFDFIYENNLYALTANMIRVILKQKSPSYKEFRLDLHKANYTTIKKSNCGKLIKYVTNNLEYYIENVFLSLGNNTEESLGAIVELLSKTYENENLKKLIVKKTNIVFDDVEMVNDTVLWPMLFENIKVKPTWENVNKYYTTFKTFDKSLNIFLNDVAVSRNLSKVKLSDIKEINKEMMRALSTSIVLNESLSIASYKTLLKSVPYTHTTQGLENISREKVDVLIHQGYLTLDTKNYEHLKLNFSGSQIALLERSKPEEIETIILDFQDTLAILKSEKVGVDIKIKLIKNTTIGLFNQYPELSNESCSVLYGTEHSELPLDLILLIIKHSDDNKARVDLAVSELKKREKIEATTESFLMALGQPFSDIINKSVSEIILDKTPENLDLIAILKILKYIGKSRTNKKTIIITTKTA